MGNVLSLRKPFESARSQLEKSLRRASIRLSKDEQFSLRRHLRGTLTLLSAKHLECLFDSSSFSSRSEHDGIGSVPAGEHAAGLPKVTFNELFKNVCGDELGRSIPVQNTYLSMVAQVAARPLRFCWCLCINGCVDVCSVANLI